MKSLLPIVLVILVLTGAITFSLAKRTVPKEEINRFGIPANELDTNTIDQTDGSKRSFFGFNQPTATPTPTLTPSVTPTPSTAGQITPLPTTSESDTKGGQTAKSTTKKPLASVTPTPRYSKNLVCTPVYGQADTCTEHIVVDTGAADSIFFNLAGFSYLAGLVSFIKAKSLKK